MVKEIGSESPIALGERNGERLFAEGPPSEWTLKTSLWELAKGRARWWARDNATGKPSYENRMPDVEFKDVWVWN